MFIELKDREIRQLVLAVKEREKKEGRTVADILCDIIYGDDAHSALEAINIYLGTIMDSDLSVDEIEKGIELGEVLPFRRKDDPTKPESNK
jgi:hypothetical protein